LRRDIDMPFGCPSWRKLLIGVCHGELKKLIDGKREECGSSIGFDTRPYTSRSHDPETLI
jgi:hypothetical protein